MTQLLGPYVALLFIHWFADFCVQTHWQASNKSKNMNALLRHVFTYTMVLMVGSWLLFGMNQTVISFVLANGGLHFVTDYYTSRVTAYFYAQKDYHNFFVVVGFDQFLHQLALAVTLIYILGA